MNQNEVTKAENNLPAVSNEAVVAGFGGEVATPIEVTWPEIKMGKDDRFVMPDDKKVAELTGHILYAQRTRNYFAKKYTGEGCPPDCASSDCIKPDFGENIQADTCSACEKSKWVKVFDEEANKELNKMPCSESLLVMFVPEGKVIPHLMRVRSSSITKKSSIAKFFTNCIDPSFALASKFQTVLVKLTLDEATINNFDTSYLMVEKVKTLEPSDPFLGVLMKLYTKVVEQFEVTYKHDEEVTPVASETVPTNIDDSITEEPAVEEPAVEDNDIDDDIPF